MLLESSKTLLGEAGEGGWGVLPQPKTISVLTTSKHEVVSGKPGPWGDLPVVP